MLTLPNSKKFDWTFKFLRFYNFHNYVTWGLIFGLAHNCNATTNWWTFSLWDRTWLRMWLVVVWLELERILEVGTNPTIQWAWWKVAYVWLHLVLSPLKWLNSNLHELISRYNYDLNSNLHELISRYNYDLTIFRYQEIGENQFLDKSTTLVLQYLGVKKHVEINF